jgi:hypothetical protein
MFVTMFSAILFRGGWSLRTKCTVLSTVHVSGRINIKWHIKMKVKEN